LISSTHGRSRAGGRHLGVIAPSVLTGS
jgi:hypothetical protein